MIWFRLYHDVTANQSLGLVAHSVGTQKHCVLAVWIYLLEFASKNQVRGSIEDLSTELAAYSLEMEVDLIQRILEKLEEKALLHKGTIKNWKNRQREREDATVADRVRRYRQKNKLFAKDNADETLRNADVTDGYAPDKEIERDTEKNKKDKSNIESQFDIFWEKYPQKIGKQDALKRFHRILSNKEASSEQILVGLESYLRCGRVLDGYVMKPSTWLNQSGWADDYASEAVLAEKRSMNSVDHQGIVIEQMRSRYEA